MTVVNDAVFSQYIDPGDIVLVNSTAGGGHISHHKVGSVGKYTRNIIDFPLTPDGYHVDVDKFEYLGIEGGPELKDFYGEGDYVVFRIGEGDQFVRKFVNADAPAEPYAPKRRPTPAGPGEGEAALPEGL